VKKATFLAMSALLVLSTLLSACSSSNSSKQSTIIIGRGGDSPALDAAIVTDGESLKITIQITETLLKFKSGTTEVEPLLASAMPDISSDGLTYKFKLRKGIKFHDGTDFNAEAVVFNFNRWLDPSSPYKFGEEDSFDYFNDMFGAAEDSVIKEVIALDEHTVQFTLRNPQAPFLQNIAMPSFAISSPKAIQEKKEKYKEEPVGTGPFKFQEWKRNDSITLVKNPDYWQKGLPKSDKLIIRSIPDNSARLLALRSGEVDLIEDVNPSDRDTVKSDSTLVEILRPSFNIGYVGFNTKKAPFDNPKVRQALSYAVDKQALIDAFYGGSAIPAINPMPPAVLGYNDKVKDYPFDLDKAKELLAAAGYPNGFDRELTFYAMPVSRPYMPDGKKVAEAIQANFAKIGVKTKIVSPEWPVYLDDTKVGDKDDLFMLGWTGDNGDPDNFLYTLLDKETVGSNNRAFYVNEDLHKLLKDAQNNPDQKKREEWYKQAQVIIKEDAPWIPLVHSTPLLAAKKDLKGYSPSPTGVESYMEMYLK